MGQIYPVRDACGVRKGTGCEVVAPQRTGMLAPSGALHTTAHKKSRAPPGNAARSPKRQRASGLGGRRSHCCGHLRARRAAGRAWWRMGACSLCRFGGWRCVGEGAGICASRSTRSRWFGRGRGLAVVRGHLVLRQAQLVVVYLAGPCGLGGGFGGLGSGLRGRSRQLGGRHRAYGCRAQRQQRGADA